MIIGQRIYTRFENGYDKGGNNVKLSHNAEKLWDKLIVGSMEGEYGYSFLSENGISIYTKKDMTAQTREAMIIHSYIFENDESHLLYNDIDKLFVIDKFLKSYEEDYPSFSEASFKASESFGYRSEELSGIDFDILACLCLKAILERTTLSIRLDGDYNRKKALLLQIYLKFPYFLRRLISFSTYEAELDIKLFVVSSFSGRETLYFDCKTGEHSPVEEKYAKRLHHINENMKLYEAFVKEADDNGSFTVEDFERIIEKADIKTGRITLFENAVLNAKKIILSGRYKEPFYKENLQQLILNVAENNKLPELYEVFNSLCDLVKEQGSEELLVTGPVVEWICGCTGAYGLNNGFHNIAKYPSLFEITAKILLHKGRASLSEKNMLDLIKVTFEERHEKLYMLVVTLLEDVLKGTENVSQILELIRNVCGDLYLSIEQDMAVKYPEKLIQFYRDVLLEKAQTSEEILNLSYRYKKMELGDKSDFMSRIAPKYIAYLFDEFSNGNDFTAAQGWKRIKELVRGTDISPYELPLSARFLDKVFIEFRNPACWDEEKWQYLDDEEFYNRLIDSVTIDEKSRDIIKLIKAIKEGILISESGVDYISLLLGKKHKGIFRSKSDIRQCEINEDGEIKRVKVKPSEERKKLIGLIISHASQREQQLEDFDMQLVINYINKDIKRTGCNTEAPDKLDEYVEGSLNNISASSLDYDPIYIQFYNYIFNKSKKSSNPEESQGYKDILNKLYKYAEENKSKYTLLKLDNIKYATSFTRLYMLGIILLYMITATVVRELSPYEYIKGCADTACFMAGGMLVFLYCYMGKGGKLKRRIDTYINISLFAGVWFIWRCILQFIL